MPNRIQLATVSTGITLNVAPGVQDFVPIDYKARLVREAAHAGVITDSELHDFMAELDEYKDMYGLLRKQKRDDDGAG
jgi:hypothetical protein